MRPTQALLALGAIVLVALYFIFKETIDTLVRENNLAVTVLLLVAGLVVVLIQFRISSRRLEDLADVADQIGRGNYEARSDDSFQDSIGNLASSVNLMAEKIGSSMAEVEEARQKLEIQSAKLESQNKANSY